jgi:hypothetical protein
MRIDAELAAEALGVERPALAECVEPAEALEPGQAAILALQRHLEVMPRHGLVQVEGAGDTGGAVAAQVAAVEVEHAEA